MPNRIFFFYNEYSYLQPVLHCAFASIWALFPRINLFVFIMWTVGVDGDLDVVYERLALLFTNYEEV